MSVSRFWALVWVGSFLLSLGIYLGLPEVIAYVRRREPRHGRLWAAVVVGTIGRMIIESLRG